jgi:hypothetical protein
MRASALWTELAALVATGRLERTANKLYRLPA